jgi:hypothetical protein
MNSTRSPSRLCSSVTVLKTLVAIAAQHSLWHVTGADSPA